MSIQKATVRNFGRLLKCGRFSGEDIQATLLALRARHVSQGTFRSGTHKCLLGMLSGGAICDEETVNSYFEGGSTTDAAELAAIARVAINDWDTGALPAQVVACALRQRLAELKYDVNTVPIRVSVITPAESPRSEAGTAGANHLSA